MKLGPKWEISPEFQPHSESLKWEKGEEKYIKVPTGFCNIHSMLVSQTPTFPCLLP